MTDRYHSLVVVLDSDIRDDDCQSTIDAILQIKGVIQVTGNVSDIDSHMAETRALRDVKNRVWAALEANP